MKEYRINDDNGYRGVEVNPRVAGMVGEAQAGAFEQVSKFGAVGLDMGLKGMEIENELRDDENYRLGMRDVRTAIQNAEADVSRGMKWQDAVKKQKDALEEKEFRGYDTLQRFRWETEALWANAEAEFDEREKRELALRAKQAFDDDLAEALESGNYENLSRVINSGRGKYLTDKRANMMLSKGKKECLGMELSKLIDENPREASRLIEAGYFNELGKSTLKNAGGVLMQNMQVNGADELTLFDVAGEGVVNGTVGRKISINKFLSETENGTNNKKVKIVSGVASPLVDMVRSYQAKGQLPTMESLVNVARVQLKAADLDNILADGGVTGLRYATYIGARKQEWADLGFSKEVISNLETQFANRVNARMLAGGDYFNFDVGKLLAKGKEQAVFVREATRKKVEEAEFAVKSAEVEKVNNKNRINKEAVELVEGLKLELAGAKAVYEKENDENAYIIENRFNAWFLANPGTSKLEQAKQLQSIIFGVTGQKYKLLDLLISENSVKSTVLLQSDKTVEKSAREALDKLSKKFDLPKKKEKLVMSTGKVTIPRAVGNYGDKNALVIGRDLFKNRLPQLKGQYEPDVKIVMANGLIYRPEEIIFVDGDVFGLTSASAVQCGAVGGNYLQGQVVFDFPNEEDAKDRKVKKLFGN